MENLGYIILIYISAFFFELTLLWFGFFLKGKSKIKVDDRLKRMAKRLDLVTRIVVVPVSVLILLFLIVIYMKQRVFYYEDIITILIFGFNIMVFIYNKNVHATIHQMK